MIIPTAILATVVSVATANSVDYFPLRPPAVPLAVRAPYTNIWSSTRDGGSLDTNGAMYWTGRDIGWSGLAAVDGKVCQWMGHANDYEHNIGQANTKKVHWDSQWSNFTFGCNGVDIEAKFFSPVDPQDLCRTSIPLSYLQIGVKSNDGSGHNVQVYTDVNGQWNTPNNKSRLVWDHNEEKGLHTYKISLQDKIKYGEGLDTSLYGKLTYTTSRGAAKGISFQTAGSKVARKQFQSNLRLNNKADKNFRAQKDGDPVFAYVHDLGRVDKKSGTTTVLYTVGTLQDPASNFLTKDGMRELQPWWKKCYKNEDNMIHFHYNDLPRATEKAAKWEQQLKNDVADYYGECVSNYKNPGKNEQDSYYSIVALSARQIMGGYLLVQRPHNARDNHLPWFLQKEISSNGNMNTVDVMFPAFPFFAYSNIDLLRYVFDPVLHQQSFFKEKYAMHDIGKHFPNATGHPDPSTMEAMPLEECGNAIVLGLVYYRESKNKKWLGEYYDMFKQFNDYLVEFSAFPDNQLSTDDFAGKLANQTNLAMKGLVGIQAMSEIAGILGRDHDKKNFTQTAVKLYNTWKTNAVSNKGGVQHTLLSYNQPNSWGMLYNAWPAYLLDLDIDGQLLKDTQHYAESLKRHKEKYGTPLDSRHELTKSDWEMWMAGYAKSDLRADLVTTLAKFVKDTTTDKAFTDAYDTLTAGYPNEPLFMARPVVGGHYTLLVNAKYGKKHNHVK